MGNALRHVRGESQKNIVRFIEGLSGKYSRWDIWQDFIIMSAIAIANTMGGPQAKAREEMYRSRAEKYSAKELEVFADMLLEVVAELERDPSRTSSVSFLWHLASETNGKDSSSLRTVSAGRCPR